MTARYALYYAPDAESEIWRLASAWLGRDAAKGQISAQPESVDIAAERFAQRTASPRRYGFHATLKAPMRLAMGVDPTRMLDLAVSFAKAQKPVSLGMMEIASQGGFLAIVPTAQSGQVTQFAANCVAQFEPIRAPLTEEERQKRLASGLTQRQSELLDQYGYPYAMEEFRLHLTLTEQLPANEHDVFERAARQHFAPVLKDAWVLDRIAVYREIESGSPFERLADFPLLG